MSTEGKEYLDDPNFILRFVNKKSSERVMELVSKIKSAFKQPEVAEMTEPARALAMIDENPELLLSCPHILDLEPDQNPQTIAPPRLASLKPFLFPFYPATAPSKPCDDPAYEEIRHKFAREARLQHERLLWSFQDRFVRDLCAADDQFLKSPFQVATTQLAREQTLPIHLVEKRKETPQTRFNSLMKKSQKRAAAVIEAQKREAKMIQDTKQFDVNFAKMQKNEPLGTLDRQYELPVTCPFSFLSDAGSAKA